MSLVVGGLLLLQALVLLGDRAMEARRESRATGIRFERLREPMPAPAVTLEHPDGSQVTLVPGQRGEALVLHFWATWCPPCREELPALLALGRRLSKSARVRVVAVATDPNWSEVRSFFNGRIPPEVFRDATGRAHQAYRVADLPDTYLITSDGLVRVRVSGAQDWRSEEALEIILRELEHWTRGGHEEQRRFKEAAWI